MKLPAIIINFKTYNESTGDNALKLAKICEKVANDTGTSIIVAPQAVDIRMIANEVSIPVFAQHIDSVDAGSNTGSIFGEAVKQAGATGTLINHSENRIPKEQIKKIVEKAKELKLTTVVCAKDPEEGKELNSFSPDSIAVEPPELIGGDISVSTAKPEVIKESVDNIDNKIIVGAGVKNGEDVKIAVKLGSVGILVASGIVKAEDPEKALLDLVSGLK